MLATTSYLDLEERSAQGFEFHIHTAHHDDSRLDHGTLT